MTDTRTLHGRILTPLGWRRGHVHFDSHIRQLQVDDHSGADDLQLPVILPGFIDLHVHGAAGVDLMQGGDVARTIARTHLRFGTTTLLATTMTAGLDEIEHALHGVAAAMAGPDADAASIVGVHLEGPFISPQRLGAQPNRTIEATLALGADPGDDAGTGDRRAHRVDTCAFGDGHPRAARPQRRHL